MSLVWKYVYDELDGVFLQITHLTNSVFSNIPLEKQYPNVQAEEKKTWEAFLRRINKIKHYRHNKPIKETTVAEEFWYEDNLPAQGTLQTG